jgi:hypothetical protein
MKPTVRLSYPHRAPDSEEADYRVESCENTVELKPGAMLSQPEVELLCKRVDVRVIMTRRRARRKWLDFTCIDPRRPPSF